MSTTHASEELTRLLSQAAWARRLARALVSAGDADDLCQDTWMKAVQQPPLRQPRAWLATVMRNLARNHRRGGDRRRLREIASTAAEPSPTPEQSLGRMEIQRLLSERVAALEEPFRQTVLLRFFDELPPSEIAKRLGVPAGTIRWRLKTAIDRLRADLDLCRPEWRRDWALLVLPAGLPAATAPAAAAVAASAGVATFPMLVAALLAVGGVGVAVGLRALANTPTLKSLPTPTQLHGRAPLPATASRNTNTNTNTSTVRRDPGPPSPGDPAFLTFEQLPTPLVQAFVAAQDRRFFKHTGVDLHATLRALFVDINAGKVEQGGSTITQQLAKQSLGDERTFGRKLRQMILASELEDTYTKEEILTLYLNRVFLGHGSWGVAAAAHRYFGKTVDQLDVAECALLAAQPHAPRRTSPVAHPDAAREARNRVLDRMVSMDVLTRAEADRWSARPVVVSLR
jgi:RNA polymerase sigma factor (sigma-70 family)